MEVKNITEGKLNGTGVFDSLMRSVEVHLDKEYKKNRFSGEDYANLYLGAMTAVLQQSIQYALTKEQSDAQAALLVAQTSKTTEEERLVTQQVANLATENANLVKQGTLLDKQAALAAQELLKTTAETSLVATQELNLEAERDNMVLQGLNITQETALVGSQNAKVQSDKALVEQQTTNLVAEAVNIPKQGSLLDKQVSKLSEDILASQSDRTLKGAQVTLTQEQTSKTQSEITAITANISKVTEETAVLAQRKKSEIAQISDTVDGVVVTGVLGKQKSLYQAQTDGYARDAEQKLAKIAMDIWSVQRTTDEGFTIAGTGLDNAGMGSIISKAKQGIGVTS